jgi:hypothetical protein
MALKDAGFKILYTYVYGSGARFYLTAQKGGQWAKLSIIDYYELITVKEKPMEGEVISVGPGKMIMRFEPREAIWFLILAWEPSPTPTITITALTPIIIPREVRRLRSLFFIRLFKATLNNFIYYFLF